MAGNEATTSQTELWSSVVHQPCEDPEDTELPSTVDMAAFSTGLTIEPAASQNHNNSGDSESDSESSISSSEESCSQSDSSDSDTSTSSLASSSRSPSPEFSVTSSQTDGLRLTIATVRKSTSSPPLVENSKMTATSGNKDGTVTATKTKKSGVSSSSSFCSSDSDNSDSDTTTKPRNNAKGKNVVPNKASVGTLRCQVNIKRLAGVKTRTRTIADRERRSNNSSNSSSNVPAKKEAVSPSKVAVAAKAKGKQPQRKRRMAASLPLSTRGSTYSTSDSEDPDSDREILASCSLQEIRQEDLAAILPDQCDAFEEVTTVAGGKNAGNDKKSPQTGDMSDSDMELPQQAVNALIQRTTESSSENESHAPPNPSSLYANSLLQQFVAQTQMLNVAPCPVLQASSVLACSGAVASVVASQSSVPTTLVGDSKSTADKSADERSSRRRRGRPKKDDRVVPNRTKASKDKQNLNQNQKKSGDYSVDPNVSPDSGIQNSPDHVVSSPEPIIAQQQQQQSKSRKISVTSNRFDRLLYANTDRVLYPPRRKGRPTVKKGPGRPLKQSENHQSQAKSVPKSVAPAVEKIDARLVLVAKTNKAGGGVKYKTLQNLKVMHSKHKKHKKYRIKILKPSNTLSKVPIEEIDKLTTDFVKHCVIGTSAVAKPPKENIPAENKVATTAKKVSKKRKTIDKKKRVNSSGGGTKNSTVDKDQEQRLPLKKRHYLFSADGKVVNSGDEDKSGDKGKADSLSPVTTATTANTTTTPKKRHRLEVVEETPKNVVSPPENQKGRPKLSLETLISELKMKKGLSDTSGPAKKPEPVTTPEKSVETSPSASSNVAKKKIRKRRAINRTGFPTVKKKKKKIVPPAPVDQKTGVGDNEHNQEGCDRVPKDGEEYDKFIERSSPVVDKWEAMSECDSLPQDERIVDEDSCSTISSSNNNKRTRSNNNNNNSSGKRERSPDLDEISLEASIERLKSRLADKNERMNRRNGKKRKRDAGEKLLISSGGDLTLNGYPKRRLRDISPASSIEPIVERRILREERGSASGDDATSSSTTTVATTRTSKIRKGKKAPKWRKRYLVAGLFSDYFKEDDEAIRIKRQESALKAPRLTYIPSEHPYGLLPPPHHCGKYLRCRQQDFRLPHDLWWQHNHSKLPGRDVVPSWNYRKVRTNVYSARIATTGACEPQTCNCTPAANCGDDCINRLVLAECPAGHRCQNQKIQRHQWAPGLEKFMTEAKGWGVKTKLPIKSGEFILEYVGEVVSDQEFKERMATIYINDNHHYCLHLDGGLVIDGHRMGGDGRFVNHSCQPNCEMQKWSVNGQFRMALFALRDIDGMEELTYDYNFSLFNLAEGQECKCGSQMCRGVIGGKSQRVRQLQNPEGGANNTATTTATTAANNNNNNNKPGRVGRPRKNQAKKANNSPTTTNNNNNNNNNTNTSNQKGESIASTVSVFPLLPPLKPLSHQQKCFILEHHCFLLRNLYKVRKLRGNNCAASMATARQQSMTPTNQGASFTNQLNALEKPRNIKTRRLAQAEENPEFSKTVKLAAVLKEIFNSLIKAQDSTASTPSGTRTKGADCLSRYFTAMPTKRKQPEFYQRIANPIDLTTIEVNIATGVYLTPEAFDADMGRLFSNYIQFYGRSHEIGIAAVKLKKVYNEAKQRSLHKVETVIGKKTPQNFVFNKKRNEEEDIIRCICGMPRDEGLMIQCERCMVWQHSECVKADVAAESYHCEQCVPRKVDYEIPLDEFTEHGHRYYMTVQRGTLQLRQGDTVYVLRDIPIPGTADKKHTYQTIGKIDYAELDIFRIERLWKDSNTGQRFAYGHHYLRPHETYHEPTRKFFTNEVMRVPLYEAVPVELVIEHCWVMDINTFCKGRPVGAPEEHIYICEYRVDKSARLFSKVSKSKFPICTKTFVFERFENRLKISRTYTPHDLDPSTVRPRGRKPQEVEEENNQNKGQGAIVSQPVAIAAPIARTPSEQKARLNNILLALLGKMPTKQALDVSYLLEGGRRRKKQKNGSTANSSENVK